LDEVERLNQEVTTLFREGKFDQALPLASNALILSERVLPADHPDIGSALNNLALLYQAKGAYDQAEPLYLRALAIKEKTGSPDDPSVATSLSNLGELYRERGAYERAEPLHQRALAIREKHLGSGHPDVAKSLNALALLAQAKGDYDRAESFFQRALTIRERVLGPTHRDVATSLNNLALLYQARGDYDRAEPLYQQALAIKETALGPDHPAVATSLNNLAELYRERGDALHAEPLYQRALAIKEKALGPDHPAIATSLNNLAELYRERGDMQRAEPLYQRALAIKEKALGPDHPAVATSLNNLAELYRERGDVQRAEPLYRRALSIREKSLGESHPDVAVSLHNLAELYREQADYDRAEPLYQRALTITEEVLGPTHPEVARAVNNLALLNQSKGNYSRAESLYLRAVTVTENAFGAEHPDVAIPLNNLALLYQMRGDPARAEPLYQRALQIFEKSFGPEHPAVATALSNLAELYRERGDISRAVSLLTQATDIREQNLAIILAGGSEHDKATYMALLSGETDSAVSLHTQAAPQNIQALRLAVTTVLRRKGRVLDAMTDSIAALRGRMDPEDRALLDDLAAIHSQLAAEVLRSGKTDPSQRLIRLDKLEARARELEAAISARSAAFKAQAQPITIEHVQQAIPEGAALVEWVSFVPFTPETSKNRQRTGQRRYVAYVLRSKGDPTWVDLGEAALIDRQIAQLREALSDPRRIDARKLAQALEERVTRPIRKLLGQTREVFVSPDGALNLIPFGALVDEDNRYLIERFSFTYLTTGRDLLRLQVKTPTQQRPLIIANPDFDGTAIATAGSQQQDNPGTGSAELPKLLTARFNALPGTEDEAKALEARLKRATVLRQAQATETALKRVHGPPILHIATHGFFLMDQKHKALPNPQVIRYEDNLPVRSVHIDNPLLRSGLALAGANQHQERDDDGVMTALEVAALDLWGTKLVVLSACETGVGDVQHGEGVYGLRRALVIAGSETQVMSLWKVHDAPTRDLIESYYGRLMAGNGRSEALRQAQLAMLSQPHRKHPYYWASFITSGQWGVLDQSLISRESRTRE
jgi:CHAT domain-containing protein/Tfp pilus assembly protein PilF